jgi:multidrug transporter EmrE-like cation transporter
MNVLLLAILGISLSVAAQFLLKAGVSSGQLRYALSSPLSFTTLLAVVSNWPLVAGFVLYGVSAILWLGVLAKWDVSKAYPMIGLGFCLSVLIGAYAGEQVTAQRVVGVSLIVLGVVVISRS